MTSRGQLPSLLRTSSFVLSTQVTGRRTFHTAGHSIGRKTAGKIEVVQYPKWYQLVGAVDLREKEDVWEVVLERVIAAEQSLALVLGGAGDALVNAGKERV